MKTVTKKLVSLGLMICIMAALLINAAMCAGVSIADAAYADELWLLEDYEYMTIGGSKRQKISDNNPAPYFYQKEGESRTAYIPVRALVKYLGGSAACSINGETINITTKGGTKCVLTKGSTAWTKGGKSQTALLLPPVIKNNEVYLSNASMKTVFGGLNSYINQDTGLIVFSTATISYNSSYSSLKTQISQIDDLLYSFPSKAKVLTDLSSAQGSATTHPRLVIDQNRFDEIRAAYELTDAMSEDDVWFKQNITRVMNTAEEYFAYAFVKTDNGAEFAEGGKMHFLQPYYVYNENGKRLYDKTSYKSADGSFEMDIVEYWQNDTRWDIGGTSAKDGYDEGGRSNLDVLSRYMKYFAFAWHMTGEQRWADACYLTAMELTKWEHWGEGHFLDCADGAYEYAIGFDWIYPAFSGTEEGRTKLRQMAEGLFVLGVEVGYNAMNGNTTYTPTISKANMKNANLKNTDNRKYPGKLHSSSGKGSNWKFNWTNNWQNVCISGMVVSALAVIEYSDMQSIASELIADMLPKLNQALYHYAPDGSYIESPGYWGYSTKTTLNMMQALKLSLGSTYGLKNTVGLHNSFYFAANITDAHHYSWNYHDSGRQRTDCETFYLASAMWNDPNLAVIRNNMLTDGSTLRAEIEDVLFYTPTLAEGGNADTALDYYGKNIETVTMRSSRDIDAIFTGLHAGANVVSHGDIDSGNFYLTKGATVWFGDRGSENYNIGSYFSNSTRYKYYRKTIIAHNSIFIRGNSSLSYGQSYNTMDQKYAKISTFVSNDEGAYAIADMTPQFNPAASGTDTTITTSAKRGLMLTNSRSTIVLQDEMTFAKAQNIVWSVEPKHAFTVSDDGKTAILGVGREKLRMTLLSDDASLKFTAVEDPKQVYLSYGIITKSNSTNEKATDPGRRLVVTADGIKSLKMAVVMDFIEDEREVVGYEWTDMANWSTSTDDWVKEADAWLDYRPTYEYTKSDLVKALNSINKAEKPADVLSVVHELPKIINGVDKEATGMRTLINQAKDIIKDYNKKIEQINAEFKSSFTSDMKLLLGLK